MEIKKEVKVFKVTYKCPQCDDGELFFVGRSKLSYPPINEHHCTNCKHTEWIKGKSYPATEYEEI